MKEDQHSRLYIKTVGRNKKVNINVTNTEHSTLIQCLMSENQSLKSRWDRKCAQNNKLKRDLDWALDQLDQKQHIIDILLGESYD